MTKMITLAREFNTFNIIHIKLECDIIFFLRTHDSCSNTISYLFIITYKIDLCNIAEKRRTQHDVRPPPTHDTLNGISVYQNATSYRTSPYTANSTQ